MPFNYEGQILPKPNIVSGFEHFILPIAQGHVSNPDIPVSGVVQQYARTRLRQKSCMLCDYPGIRAAYVGIH